LIIFKPEKNSLQNIINVFYNRYSITSINTCVIVSGLHIYIIVVRDDNIMLLS